MLRFPRVLLVDDDALVTETLAPMLRKKMGYDARVAGSAEEALQLVEQEAFDLVMADFQMPGMNGLELLQRLRRERTGIKLVAVTAHREDFLRAAGLAISDIDALITKPYSLVRMERTLRHLLAGGREPVPTAQQDLGSAPPPGAPAADPRRVPR